MKLSQRARQLSSRVKSNTCPGKKSEGENGGHGSARRLWLFMHHAAGMRPACRKYNVRVVCMPTVVISLCQAKVDPRKWWKQVGGHSRQGPACIVSKQHHLLLYTADPGPENAL